jgi:hypothetical protein
MDDENVGLFAAYDRAVERINQTAALQPYREHLLADWPEGKEHYLWVAEAPIGEILSWVIPLDETD